MAKDPKIRHIAADKQGTIDLRDSTQRFDVSLFRENRRAPKHARSVAIVLHSGDHQKVAAKTLRKTLILWALLVISFLGIWQLLGKK